MDKKSVHAGGVIPRNWHLLEIGARLLRDFMTAGALVSCTPLVQPV
jgi:hypothetical protein